MKSLLTLIALFAFAATAGAVKTDRWEIDRPAEFMRGRLDRLALTSDNGLKLGFGSKRLGDFAQQVWCSTVTADGRVWFGTGSSADVYYLRADNEPVKAFETDTIAVTALGADTAGNIYAATMADGKIFKITGGDQPKGELFCRLPALYVWTLAVAPDGVVYAGTGPDGGIYRIAADGKFEEWYTAADANIVSLAFDTNGSLLAGGGERGLLYRVTGRQQATVVHEFSEDEIKSIVVGHDGIFVAANKQKKPHPRTPPTERPTATQFARLTQDLTDTYGAQDAGADEAATRGDVGSPLSGRMGNLLSGTLYRVNADGRVDRWAVWNSESILCLALDNTGAVLTAMGGKGRVYRVPNNREWEMLFNFEEKEALTLATRQGRLAFVGAGNVGAGYLVEPERAETGEFISNVHDARFLSTWGNMTWQGTGAVEVSTRSGNEALPGKTWSDWSAPITAATGKIQSPRSRFLQVRARLTRASNPQLLSLAVYSQVQNQKPEIITVQVGQPPADPTPRPTTGKTKPSAPTGSKSGEDESATSLTPAPVDPARTEGTNKTISWRATDKDGDTLVYRLYFRAENDEVWLPVFVGKPMADTKYKWDTESVPDGWYRVKVVASDEQSNAAGTELTDEKLSDRFRIDNRRPEILALAWDRSTGRLTGRARDNLSRLQRLEYSVDGADWEYFAPADGVLDDPEESFDFELALTEGPHTVAVRATDEHGNIGVGKIIVPQP